MKSVESSAEGNVDQIVMETFFKGTASGVFVDVGAARPDYLSISARYRANGWRVIAIEPNPEFCELHRARGHEVLQYACGDRDEDNVDFTIVDSHGCEYGSGKVSYESFSSLGIKDSYAALRSDLETKKINVNLRRLDTILQTHAGDIKRIDVLSIDVEGWELEVLDGFNVRKYRPRVMIVENLFNDEAYRRYLAERNYVLWSCIEPNDIYIERDPSSAFGMRLRKFLRIHGGKRPTFTQRDSV